MMGAERRQFRGSAVRGRPQVDTAIGRTVNLRYRGEGYAVDVFRLAPDAYRVQLDDHSVDVFRDDLGRAGVRLEIGDRVYRVLATPTGSPTSSRSTGTRTASPTTRVASSGRPRRRSSWRSTSSPATRSRRRTVSW